MKEGLRNMGHLCSLKLFISYLPISVSLFLYYASRSGHEEVCQLLLEQGEDVNAQTRSGKVSSLHRVAYSGHVSVVNLLIRYGADPRLCDSDGQIPLHKVTMKLLWFEMNLG